MNPVERIAAGLSANPSLGTRMDMEHFAATPRGMRVELIARVTGVEGSTIHFALSARDAVEKIGRGQHERMWFPRTGLISGYGKRAHGWTET